MICKLKLSERDTSKTWTIARTHAKGLAIAASKSQIRGELLLDSELDSERFDILRTIQRHWKEQLIKAKQNNSASQGHPEIAL